jgi:hypothetical protein
MAAWDFPYHRIRGLDLSGFDVEAVDGRVGKVDEAGYAEGESFLLVNTGRVFGKKVILPAGTVNRIELDSKRVFVDPRKDDVKNAPEHEPGRRLDEAYRRQLAGYYRLEQAPAPEQG